MDLLTAIGIGATALGAAAAVLMWRDQRVKTYLDKKVEALEELASLRRDLEAVSADLERLQEAYLYVVRLGPQHWVPELRKTIASLCRSHSTVLRSLAIAAANQSKLESSREVPTFFVDATPLLYSIVADIRSVGSTAREVRGDLFGAAEDVRTMLTKLDPAAKGKPGASEDLDRAVALLAEVRSK